jgi:hypothetical protein
MPTATTKAQLAEALEAANARISELEAAAQAPAPAAAAPHLSQVLWLQRKGLTEAGPDGRGNISYTAGGTLVVRFGAQYASLDRKSGQRVFGPWKFFSAYGDMASTIVSFMQGGDRLALVEAYEEPWASSTDANARNSDWTVRGFSPIGRGAGNPPMPQARPEAAPALAAAAPVQPQLAPLAF